MATGIEFYTVGQLRKALADLPDDQFLVCQVAGQEGGAWNLCGTFFAPSKGPASLVFKHPALIRLPMENDTTKEGHLVWQHDQ